jgi:hypothetical protein
VAFGDFTALPIADLVFTIAQLVLFQRGTWKQRRI